MNYTEFNIKLGFKIDDFNVRDVTIFFTCVSF